MKTATTQSDRLALIKEIAERKKKDLDIPKESNMYHWTDASKYAKEYYGETMFETTRYDNDWD